MGVAMKLILRVLALILFTGVWGQVATAGYVHNDPLNYVDPNGEVTLKVGLKVKGPSTNSQVAGGQGEVGLAVSIPIPGIDPAGTQADIGVYSETGGTLNGSVGAGGLGKTVLVLGAQTGDVQGMSGEGAEVSFQSPYKIVPGKNLRSTVLRTVAKGVGGEINFDAEGNVNGAAATIGPGVEVGGSGTNTSVVSVRSLAEAGVFDPVVEAAGTIRTPEVDVPSPSEVTDAVRVPWD